MGRTAGEEAERLSARLEERGEPVTPRQLERWRQAGLLSPVRQRGAGRGRGSTVEAADDSADRVVEAARLVRSCGAVSVAVLTMFGEGRHRIEKPELERAYAKAYGELGRRIQARSAGGASSASTAVGGAIAKRASRRRDLTDLRARLKEIRTGRRFESIQGMLEDRLTDLALIVLTGQARSRAGVAELLDATGVTGLATDLPAAQPPIVSSMPDLTTQLQAMSARSLSLLVRRTSLDHLETGRDYANTLRAFARARSSFNRSSAPNAFGFAAVARTSPLSVAIAAPVIASLERLFPGEILRSQALFQESIPSRL